MIRHQFFNSPVKKYDLLLDNYFIVDRLGHDKYWIVFFGKIFFYFKEIRKLPNSVKIDI